MVLAIACALASAAWYQSASPPPPDDFSVASGVCACDETALCCPVVTNGSTRTAFFSGSAGAGFGGLATAKGSKNGK